MAAMVVMRSGILVTVIGWKLLFVGIGLAVRSAFVFRIMGVCVNHASSQPCEDAEEKEEAGKKAHVGCLV